jgi:acyl-CoA thioesterase-1
LAGFIAALSLCSACGRTPQIAPLSNDAVIVAFGDSLTRGIGADDEHAYPELLQKRIGVTVINEGISGEITADPDLVILLHGGNDILRKLPRDETRENLQSMIDQIRDGGADVVLIGVPEFNFFSDTAPIYHELAEANAVPTQLEILGRLERKPRYKSDGVHLNNEGYAKLAGAIYELIADAGAL